MLRSSVVVLLVLWCVVVWGSEARAVSLGGMVAKAGGSSWGFGWMGKYAGVVIGANIAFDYLSQAIEMVGREWARTSALLWGTELDRGRKLTDRYVSQLASAAAADRSSAVGPEITTTPAATLQPLVASALANWPLLVLLLVLLNVVQCTCVTWARGRTRASGQPLLLMHTDHHKRGRSTNKHKRYH